MIKLAVGSPVGVMTFFVEKQTGVGMGRSQMLRFKKVDALFSVEKYKSLDSACFNDFERRASQNVLEWYVQKMNR